MARRESNGLRSAENDDPELVFASLCTYLRHRKCRDAADLVDGEDLTALETTEV